MNLSGVCHLRESSFQFQSRVRKFRESEKAIYGDPETCGHRGGPGSAGPGPHQPPDLLSIPLCPIPPGGRWDRDGRDSPGLAGQSLQRSAE